MTELLTIYKIRKKGTKLYSRGRVHQEPAYNSDAYVVKWKANGKEWTTEKALKQHLLNCAEKGVDLTNWEIMIFTQEPSKSLTEWCDAKMTMAMLKHVNNK